MGIPAELRLALADVSLMAAMIDIVPHPIFFKDARFRYIGCNEHFARMLGVPIENIIGRTVDDIAPPHLARVYREADIQLMEQGGAQRYKAAVRYGDGVLHRGVFFKSVYYDEAGAKAGLVGLFYPLEFMLEAMDL